MTDLVQIEVRVRLSVRYRLCMCIAQTYVYMGMIHEADAVLWLERMIKKPWAIIMYVDGKRVRGITDA